MGDSRIVSGGQNKTPIIAADVLALIRRNAIPVVLVNASGDIYNAVGGGGVGSDVNLATINGQTPALGAGNADPGTLRVVIVTDQGTLPVSGSFTAQVTAPAFQTIGGLVGITGDSRISQGGAWAVAGTGDFSTTPKAGQVWPTREQGVHGVYLVNPGGRVSISGDQLAAVQQGAWGVAVTGDASVRPAAGVTFPVVHQGPIGVQVVGGQVGGSHGVSGDVLSRQSGAWAVAVTGDAQVKPSPGVSFPVTHQGPVGAYLVGQNQRIGVSGDVNIGNEVDIRPLDPGQDSVRIHGGNIGVTGDVSTTPKAGQTWPVREQGVVGVQVVGGQVGGSHGVSGDVLSRQVGGWAVAITGDVLIRDGGPRLPVAVSGPVGAQIVGGSVGAQVSPSGDFMVRLGLSTTPIGVTGDVSTKPAAGQVWPVREQNVQGVYIVGGSGQGTAGISGDVAIKPSQTTNIGRFPVSGDTGLSDGANRSILASVKQYANSNPVAVVLTNASGDTYLPVLEEPLMVTRSGRVTSGGATTIAGPYNGRVIKVSRFNIQSEADIARTMLHSAAAGASGEQLTPQWNLGAREGVVESVSGIGGGYLFKTQLNQALVLHLQGQAVNYSITFQSGDAF